MTLRTLIDLATEKAGNQTQLAQMLQVTQQDVSKWKTGKRYCTTPTRIELCKIAGYDLKTALIEQVIEGLDPDDQVQAEAGAMLRAVLDAFPQEKSFRKNSFRNTQQPRHSRGCLKITSYFNNLVGLTLSSRCSSPFRAALVIPKRCARPCRV